MFWKLWRFEKKNAVRVCDKCLIYLCEESRSSIVYGFYARKIQSIAERIYKKRKEGRADGFQIHSGFCIFPTTTTLCAAFHSQRSSKIITITNRRNFSSTHPTLFRSQIFRIFTIFRIFLTTVESRFSEGNFS